MRWLWTIAVVAERFKVLPSVVARDLASDRSSVTLQCIPLLDYAQAKGALDSAKDPDAIKPWEKSPVMARVKRNTITLQKERAAKRRRGKA